MPEEKSDYSDIGTWKLGEAETKDITKVYVAKTLVIDIPDKKKFTGGGAVSNFKLVGDFDIQVDYTNSNLSEGVAAEMAVVNSNPPESILVHSNPPFVGSELDEDDGPRINWNSGTTYEENKYGRTKREGAYKIGKLRLKRDNNRFTSYYWNGKEWMQSGQIENPKMNNKVHVRLAAKHWSENNYPPATVTFMNFQINSGEIEE